MGACSTRVLEERGHQAPLRSWGLCPQRGEGLAVLPSPGLVLECWSGWHCGCLPGLGAWSLVSASPQGTRPRPGGWKALWELTAGRPCLWPGAAWRGRVGRGGGWGEAFLPLGQPAGRGWCAGGLTSQGLSCLIWICDCDSFRFIEQVPPPHPPTASAPDIFIWIVPWGEGQPVLCRGSAASLTSAPTGCQ